ncbi:MAG: hypothetical protein HN623_01570, partial [Bdellovibrionales bacterium]|nr:hypothetical protein [Bdellovibrionales bacterium]
MRNGLLLLAIIVALTAIYFLEEQEERKSAKIIEQRRTIISSTILKHLTEIRGNNFHLIKDDHGFHTKDSKVKVDPQHVTSFIKIVTAIKAIKEISAQEIDSTLTSIFANKAPYIEFYIAAQKKVTITLGSKLGYDTSFYLRATDNSNDHTRYYIAEDTNPINQLFMVTRSKSLHNSKAYHQRMTNLFNISDHFFYDLKLLQLSAGEKITNIKVKNLRNRPFSVDAQKITTSPLERSHLAKDNPTQIENFLQLINTMRATEYYPQTNPQDLANRVASFIIS